MAISVRTADDGDTRYCAGIVFTDSPRVVAVDADREALLRADVTLVVSDVEDAPVVKKAPKK